MNVTAILTAIVALLTGGFIGHEIGDNSSQMNQYGNGRQGQQMEMTLPEPIDYVSVRPELASIPVSDLSEDEMADILWMREEEKLARDVYTTLYDKWGQRIFINIAQSEQTHTEAVRDLIVKYDLTDPVTDDTVGVFNDPDLQKLYDDLVEQGSASLEEALKVGALIEDLDIADLQEATAQTDNEDIRLVYSNLERGSRNHLRSFTSQLENMGVEYEPQYISEAYYEEIVGSDRETGEGVGAGSGNSQGGGQGQGSRGGGRGWGRI